MQTTSSVADHGWSEQKLGTPWKPGTCVGLYTESICWIIERRMSNMDLWLENKGHWTIELTAAKELSSKYSANPSRSMVAMRSGNEVLFQGGLQRKHRYYSFHTPFDKRIWCNDASPGWLLSGSWIINHPWYLNFALMNFEFTSVWKSVSFTRNMIYQWCFFISDKFLAPHDADPLYPNGFSQTPNAERFWRQFPSRILRSVFKFQFLGFRTQLYIYIHIIYI